MHNSSQSLIIRCLFQCLEKLDDGSRSESSPDMRVDEDDDKWSIDGLCGCLLVVSSVCAPLIDDDG